MTMRDREYGDISAAHMDWADARPGGHHRPPPDPVLCYADHLARRQGRWRKRRDPRVGYSAFWLALALLGLAECFALIVVTP